MLNLAVLVFLVFIYVYAVRTEEKGVSWWTSVALLLVLTALCGVAVYAVGALTYVFLGLAISGTWLIGTRLRQRAGLRGVTVDLRTGDVRLDECRNALVVKRLDRDITVEVLLRSGELTLPRAQLIALADAVDGLDGRPELRQLADHVRALAEGIRPITEEARVRAW